MAIGYMRCLSIWIRLAASRKTSQSRRKLYSLTHLLYLTFRLQAQKPGLVNTPREAPFLRHGPIVITLTNFCLGPDS